MSTAEKQSVAFSSVLAAIFLTAIKIIVGIFSGSLGILSEAAHSALDLGAAVVTFFAVKFSDKPADIEHNYGHGKIESFSALIETALLLITCFWIIHEAFGRLFFGKSLVVSDTYWGIGIMILSIIINISRAKALNKVAKKYGSQALEADALHFSSDVWSSIVVIGGLICVQLGNYFNIRVLDYGDPVAALGVSILVIVVSLQLGKRTIDVLLDAAPKGMINSILHEVNGVNGILEVANIRVRPSGPKIFIDINVGINKNESHRVVHTIVREVREKLLRQFINSDITISTFPVLVEDTQDREIYHIVKKVVDQFPNCTNIHNIHVYEVAGEKYIAIHLEVKEPMNLKDSHQLSHEIGTLVQAEIEDAKDVSVNFEYVKQQLIQASDITAESQNLIKSIHNLINKEAEKICCNNIKVYQQDNRLTIFLQCAMSGDYTTEKIESISKAVSTKLRENIKNLENIHMHIEPINEELLSD